MNKYFFSKSKIPNLKSNRGKNVCIQAEWCFRSYSWSCRYIRKLKGRKQNASKNGNKKLTKNHFFFLSNSSRTAWWRPRRRWRRRGPPTSRTGPPSSWKMVRRSPGLVSFWCISLTFWFYDSVDWQFDEHVCRHLFIFSFLLSFFIHIYLFALMRNHELNCSCQSDGMIFFL